MTASAPTFFSAILPRGESLLIILAVGLIAGWLAGQIVRGTGFGLVADLCSQSGLEIDRLIRSLLTNSVEKVASP